MRPILLAMTAFGPYREREIIDFTQLEDHRIFVISGNTGAGKTTVFDAICYALYGSASGEDRSEPRMLRSHFASEEIHTSVELTFAVGARVYRVFRQMGHRKGGNKTETGAKIELYEQAAGQEIPLVDRFTVPDVNAAIEQIIGLSKDQFSQIVMLPQGEFRKLLTSDTDNKEEILRRIFRTDMYQKLEEHFHRKSRQLKEELNSAKLELDMHMKQPQATLPVREGSRISHTLQQEFYNALQVIEGLHDEIVHYKQLAAEAEARKAALNESLQKKEEQHREAIAIQAKLDELAQKREKRTAMEQQQAEIAELERKLELAERAAQIEPIEEMMLAAMRDAEDKQKQTEHKRGELEKAEQAWIEAEKRWREEEAQESRRTEAERELRQLMELVPVVDTLDARNQEVKRLRYEEHSCKQSLERVEAELGAAREFRREKSEQIRRMESETSSLPEKREALSRLRQQALLMKDMLELEKQIQAFVRLEEEREQMLRKIRAEHDHLETLWVEGQAALLAKHLHQGDPCPVCGSVDHPRKGEAAGPLPSREELQEAKNRLRHCEQELSEAKAQAAASRTGWQSKSAELLAEYGAPSEEIAEQYSRMVQEGKKLKAEVESLEQLTAQLQQEKQVLEQAEERMEKLSQDKERFLEQYRELTVQLNTKQSLLDKELERIPEQLRSAGQLAVVLQQQQAQLDLLVANWKQAQEQWQHARTRLAEEKASLLQMEKHWAEAQAREAQLKERFELELSKAGFTDTVLYQAARMPESARLSERSVIESFKTAYAVLVQQLDELERALAGQEPVDLQQLTADMTEIKQSLEQTAAELQLSWHYVREADRIMHAIESADRKAKDLERQLEQIMDVYQALKGDNPLKLSFERYILIEFLEQILHAANVRLHDLSGGQFILERSDRLESRGKQSGLGLDVYDAYTGQYRDVKTLSGGEKFNASLSLALGMSDVIQSHQGGISIEMMFIDEGFGSLDEESLHKAIAALIDLQRSGRMIGVISHVQELKAAFPAILQVSKTREGYSRTQIVVK